MLWMPEEYDVTDIDFNFDEIGNGSGATGMTVPNLLAFISRLHAQLADAGAWESLETTTHNELMALAAQADRAPVDLETPRMLVLSTAHITSETSDLFQADAEELPPFYLKGDYGWIIPIVGDEPFPDTCPADLLAIRKVADEAGCTWIMLDGDASQVEGLPTYDW